MTANGQKWEFDGRGHIRVSDRYDIVDYERVPAAQLTVDELKAIAGTYVSDEAETVVGVTVDANTVTAAPPRALLACPPTTSTLMA